MCEIVGINKIKGKIILDCSEYDGSYSNAKTLTIIDESGKTISLSNFRIEKNRNCFSDNRNSPWIAIDDDIDKNFIKIGNEIDFSD